MADPVIAEFARPTDAMISLDPVVKATPADISLVVVGGQPLYGDPALLARLLPAGAKLDQMTVCGAQKAFTSARATPLSEDKTSRASRTR